ncbi:MAG: RsmE family RNA methyltransferase [Cyclobacteriaceae bacterium]
MQIFYCVDIKSEVTLNETESQHAIKVLRLKRGDIVQIINGEGSLFEGAIAYPHPKKCEVEGIRKIQSTTEPNEIHLVIAPTKNHDRMEWLIEKVTEIGVTRVSFIECKHSERRKVNVDRLERKALSALKQCQGLWLPEINDIRSFSEVIEKIKTVGKYIAHLDGTNRNLLSAGADNNNHTILIGPEGDFSAEEIQIAQNHKFQPISLGGNTLRTETAGIYAVVLLKNI